MLTKSGGKNELQTGIGNLFSPSPNPLGNLTRTIYCATILQSLHKPCFQVFLLEAKCWGKEHKGYEKKLLEAYTPYLQKCAEICWMMALHDPPLYMKMDSKPGEKFDLNIFTVYSTTGDKLDYIVWPPLYNGRDGGLLSKGSAEPVRTIVKKK